MRNRGEGRDDEEGRRQVLIAHERTDGHDRLDGLAEAHLVGQDAVEAVIPAVAQPVNACASTRRG